MWAHVCRLEVDTRVPSFLCMWAHVCRQELDIRVSLYAFHFTFGDRISHWTLISWFQLDWLYREVPGKEKNNKTKQKQTAAFRHTTDILFLCPHFWKSLRYFDFQADFPTVCLWTLVGHTLQQDLSRHLLTCARIWKRPREFQLGEKMNFPFAGLFTQWYLEFMLSFFSCTHPGLS